jgi:ABC-type Fe3+-hydroxamate transport system substrate-binding protein
VLFLFLGMRYTDQMGFSGTLAFPPRRIVSLVPSQTELLFTLGLDAEVTGITRFCVHPPHWRKTKTIVGGTKKFHFDTIARLQPDLIIGNKEENYREGIEQLRQHYPVWMSDIATLPEALRMMQDIGTITGRETQAQQLITDLQQRWDRWRNDRLTQVAVRKRVVYLIWRDPWMAAGKDTFIDAMLQEAGFENVVTDPRYPEISEATLESLQPDMILLSSEPYPFKDAHIQEWKTILPEARVKLVDGEMFSWYGSRLLNAPDYFRTLA